MLDRATAPARSGSIYLRPDLSIDLATVMRRAHQAARGERAHQTSRFQSGKCALEPDSYRVIFREKLAREMGAAVEARQNRRFWQTATPAQRTAAFDFADQVGGRGAYAL